MSSNVFITCSNVFRCVQMRKRLLFGAASGYGFFCVVFGLLRLVWVVKSGHWRLWVVIRCLCLGLALKMQSWQQVLLTISYNDSGNNRYARDLPKICPRYALDMPKICTRYAQDMPEMCLRYACDMPKKYSRCDQDRPEICPRYAQDMHEICPRYAQDMQKICPRYAQDMQEICPRYAQDMPEICPRYAQDMH